MAPLSQASAVSHINGRFEKSIAVLTGCPVARNSRIEELCSSVDKFLFTTSFT